jgi:hypothetical protein
MAITSYGDIFLTFLVKLVLEVFGGGGAIWGFSEACGLRNANTIWFWRPVALTVAFLFSIRWILQIQQAIEEKRRFIMVTTELSNSKYQDVPREDDTCLKPLEGN